MISKFFQLKSPTLSGSLKKLKSDLKKRKQNSSKQELSAVEKAMIKGIKERTDEWNKDNSTRTKAYLDYYLKHPEIHWAFLAHMVSRNAGWNMTDLKGEFLSKLLTNKEAVSFFTFIERGNWLIFQDAYPQLLVYEESKKRGENLFYLLPYLHISTFMEAIWVQYWNETDSYLITSALIINEQNYLESRVIQNPLFQKEVIGTMDFSFQDYLSLNHILFPFFKNQEIKLVGQTVHQFESLKERICLGKRLYSVLFDDKERLKMVENWAKHHPHSGSRKDYWPHLFHDIHEGLPGKINKPRIKSCKVVSGSARIYSPTLEFSWKEMNHAPAEIYDWFHDWRVIYFLNHAEEKYEGKIEGAYCSTIEMLELAAYAKKVIF